MFLLFEKLENWWNEAYYLVILPCKCGEIPIKKNCVELADSEEKKLYLQDWFVKWVNKAAESAKHPFKYKGIYLRQFFNKPIEYYQKKHEENFTIEPPPTALP